MDFNCIDFSKLTLNDVADALLVKLHEEGKGCARALLKGKDQDGEMYNLILFLEVTDD